MPTCLQTSNKPLQGDSDASTTINAETCCSGGRNGLMKRWSDPPEPVQVFALDCKDLSILLFYYGILTIINVSCITDI